MEFSAWFPNNLVFVTEDTPKVSTRTITLRDMSAKFNNGDNLEVMWLLILIKAIPISRIRHQRDLAPISVIATVENEFTREMNSWAYMRETN